MAMDSDTLHTASTYLNNLLQARGLLRNGKPLDFAKPTREARAQTINLVHDLLLRRDREQESREHAASALRKLRTECDRKDAELERLQARLAEKDRNTTQAQVEARNARADMKKLETSNRALQDKVAKLMATLEQVKTQCINDVRKRDLQLERLRSHIQSQQRGNKSGLVAPSISISGGTGGARASSAFNASMRSLADPEYSLKQETNDFLTQLSQGLSDENDSMMHLVKDALRALKEMLGMPETLDKASISRSGPLPTLDETIAEEQVPSTESLAEDMNTAIETLRNLLTSPNFVSVEEVDVRDEEIARLREGWEQMETRWKEVLIMMDGWRRKMERTGNTIDLEDLRQGLTLGAMKNAIQGVDLEDDHVQEESGSSNRDSGISGVTDPLAASDFFAVPPRTGQKLRQLNSNIQSPRKVAFADGQDCYDESTTTASKTVRYPDLQTPIIIKSMSTAADSMPPSSVRASSRLKLRSGGASTGPRTKTTTSQSRKRHSSPHPLPLEPPSKHQAIDNSELQSSSFLEDLAPTLTMEQKLQAAQMEAAEAANAPSNLDDEDERLFSLEMEDAVGKLRSPAKASKIKGRPRRRKSTLNPEELEVLLGIE